MMKPHKEGILQAEKGTATVEAKTMENLAFSVAKPLLNMEDVNTKG